MSKESQRKALRMLTLTTQTDLAVLREFPASIMYYYFTNLIQCGCNMSVAYFIHNVRGAIMERLVQPWYML